MEQSTNKPICCFQGDKHLQETLRYWRKVLFLEHWLIKAVLVSTPINDKDNGTSLEGVNNVTPVSRAAFIQVCQHDYKTIEKHCEELTLVHELLHCKYAYLENTDRTLESAVYEVEEHAKLHEMARSLLMVRYGIDFDWFRSEESRSNPICDEQTNIN